MLKTIFLSRFQKIHALINNAANNPKMEGGDVGLDKAENLPEKIWNDDISVGLPGFFCSVFWHLNGANEVVSLSI